ncbi:glycosyltransferase [Corynebacterium casei]|uniref:glycosyltransferase n=1 Tax=Corynebacterium casei TaxID=160386 RepID=UPI003FD32185
MSSPIPSSPEPNVQHKVVVSTPYYVPAYLGGGPIQTLKALINAAPSEFKTRVVCTNHDLGQTTPLTDHPNRWVEVGAAQVQYVGGGIRSHIRALKQTDDADIIYLNSLFNPRYSLLPMLLKRLGFWKKATLLIAPRGELDPGALALKTHKKKAFLTAFKLLRLHNSILWHASTPVEKQQIRKQFGDVTVLVRENETSLPQKSFTRPPRKTGPARLLFVSRLDEKKGLHVLLESLKNVSQPIKLKIIGAFENSDYEFRCRRHIEQLGENISVEFNGSLERNEVLKSMQSADLMVFPTAGENFGHVIAEALSQSCPVMCSANSPWTSRLEQGGGIVVQPNTPEAWANATENFLSKPPSQWEESSAESGRIFNLWRNEEKGEHVFALLTKLRTQI